MEKCSPIRSNPQYFREPSEAGTSQTPPPVQQDSQEATASPSGVPRDNPSPALVFALKDLPRELKVKVLQKLEPQLIAGMRFLDRDFRAAGAEAIKHVSVARCAELEAAIEAYKEGGITKLTVTDGNLTDNHLSALLSRPAQLENLRRLERLNLYGCRLLTDEGLKHLYPLTSLRHLQLIGGVRLTHKGVEDLRKQLGKDCIVEARGVMARPVRPIWADGAPQGC